jgi:hypothetical protein
MTLNSIANVIGFIFLCCFAACIIIGIGYNKEQ